jgi:RNA polymerase sigma-70 factor (ECF subfamily)
MAEKTSASVHDEVRTAIAAGAYQQALELLAQAYMDTVYRYCCRMLRGDTGRAMDVTQQVYEEACKGIVGFRGASSAKTWLFAIARNQCLKEIVVHERHSDLLHMHRADLARRVHTEPSWGSEAEVLSQDGLRRLQWALDQLEPEERSLLIMRFGVGVANELSVEEIATILGLSRASAYRKLKEALARLRRMVHDEAT